MNYINFKRIILAFCLILIFNIVWGQKRIEHFVTTTINNEQIKIGDNKNIFVFYLWETKSKISHNEIRALNELETKYESSNVIFIAATNDKLKKLKAFLNNTEFLYQQVCGKEGKKIMKLFNNNGLVRIFPRHFIIGKNGDLVTSAIGSCLTIHSLIETELNKL